jgi:hypothetical protein
MWRCLLLAGLVFGFARSVHAQPHWSSIDRYNARLTTELSNVQPPEHDAHGIVVIVGSAVGSLLTSALVHEAFDPHPKVSAAAFGAGVAAGAIAGAAAGRRKPAAMWTTAGAAAGTIPLVLVAQRTSSAENGLDVGLSVLTAALLPLFGSWLGNTIAQ